MISEAVRHCKTKILYIKLVNYCDKKYMAVLRYLLATSAIMFSEKEKRKRKMCSKKWYLKRNISFDVHLLNELLETDVP